MEYVKRLDGLRGLAVIMVLIQHLPAVQSVGILNSVHQLYKTLGLGYIGVELFFLLSGYLITTLLLLALEKNERHVLRNFYIKRAIRILPVFFLTIACCYVLWPQFTYSYIAGFLGNYYFAFNADPHPLRHFWSLAVEEQFYLIWPLVLIVFARSRDRIGKLLLSLMILSITITLVRDVWIATDISRALIHRSVETRMLALCAGGYLAVYGIPKYSLRALLALLGGAVIAVFCFRLMNQADLWPYMKSTKTLAFFVVSLVIFLLVASSASPLKALFESKPLVATGIISYGLYVYHLPLFYYMGLSHMQMKGKSVSLSEAVLMLILAFALATISWFLMEKPLRRARGKFLADSTSSRPGKVGGMVNRTH